MRETGKEWNRNVPVVLNLCDDFPIMPNRKEFVSGMVRNLETYAPFPFQITGIRIGAETCGFLFERLSLERLKKSVGIAREALGQENLEVSLVVPVVEQSAWEKSKEFLTEALSCGRLSAVTVNDFGALKVVSEERKKVQTHFPRLHLGRYFDKRPRDPRGNGEVVFGENKTILDTEAWQPLIRRFHISGIEMETLDTGSDITDCNLEYYVHLPYTLVSSGQICEYSGIGRSGAGRFAIGQCARQCKGVVGIAHHDALKKMLVKAKNALYMKTPVNEQNLQILSRTGVSVIYTEL